MGRHSPPPPPITRLHGGVGAACPRGIVIGPRAARARVGCGRLLWRSRSLICARPRAKRKAPGPGELRALLRDAQSEAVRDAWPKAHHRAPPDLAIWKP